MEQTIKLELTVNEVNALLNILAQKPYIEVAQFIHQIHQQAFPQLPQQEEAPKETAPAAE